MSASAATVAQPQPITFQQVLDAGFWQREFPQLNIGKRSACGSPTRPHQSYERLSERMRKDGYFGESDALLGKLSPALASAISHAVELGLPPVFIFLFDEPWECYHRLQPVVSHILGDDYKLLPDFWMWHVDPCKRQSGWKPHRDKGHWALAPDGSPLSLTIWVPLTPATTMNGCMYIVPAQMDPTYGTPQDTTYQFPISAARALPSTPGDYLCWNQAVYHWGSTTSEFVNEPRMSMALEFQRGDIKAFNEPLLPQAPFPDFNLRLPLVAKQILQYQHMYGFSQNLCDLAAYILNQAGIAQPKPY